MNASGCEGRRVKSGSPTEYLRPNLRVARLNRAAVTRLGVAVPSSVIRANFEEATKTFWTEQELRRAELTTKGTLYEV